jgi:serine O-acetyltransferase
MAVDRSYFMKIGARTVAIQIRALDFRLDIDAQQEVAATTLALNGIGQVEIEADRPIPFDPYDQNRDTGGFILINRITNSTIAAGMLRSSIDSAASKGSNSLAHQAWNLERVVSKLRALRDEWRSHQHRDRDAGGREFPSLEVLKEVLKGLSAALFPMRLGPATLRKESEDVFVRDTLSQALTQLKDQILLELHGRARQQEPRTERDAQERANQIVQNFAEQLPEVRRLLDLDVEAAYRGDPAASSVDEILLCYPGVAAIMHYRLAHALSMAGLPLIARIIAEIAHSETGVDIHPAAKIGESFFIDHGTGVVIGGTATIGRNVRIYQAVTLGAKRLTAQDGGLIDRSQPRHPQVEDDVIIYAGATILGFVTIGKGSTIGGNVWLTHSVPANSQITQAQSQAAPC